VEFPALLLARMQILTIAHPAFPLGYNKFSNNLPKNVFAMCSPTAALTIGAMKARVYVSMKPTVLDPQGQTICSALNSLGHKEIASVRQGKYFEIGVADGTSREMALQALDEIARDVLSNPVIEDYRVEILD
jgi:phosphoribosylformylglycinamidine synthase PurS subunit